MSIRKTGKKLKASKQRKSRVIKAFDELNNGWEEPEPGEKFTLFRRLARCSHTLKEKREALDPDDARWLSSILFRVLEGEDVRPMFLVPPSPGRRHTNASDRDLWIAVDALLETKESGLVGKVLWGRLAERWGYPDGSIKNAISRERFAATRMLANLSVEELEDALPQVIAEHKNSRN